MFRKATLAIFMALTTPAIADPIIGRWSNTHICNEEDDGAFNLTPRGEKGWEHSCDFTNVRREGQAWHVTADCGGEGEEWKMVVRLSVNASGKLVYQTLWNSGTPNA